jgi:protocatechuate 3,4-dioxygenase, beta subunit
MNNDKINRRNWLRLGLGLAAGTATGFSSVSDGAAGKECKTTPGMELGPFPPILTRTQPDHDVDLTRVEGQPGVATGDIIEVTGRILDENCNPVNGSIVEIWQANHYGKYNHEYNPNGQHDPHFQGWGQVITKQDGKYSFITIVPGLYGNRARHIHFKISKLGYHEMVTQLYFHGEERNDTDGIYNALTHQEQRAVTRSIDRTYAPKMEFNINIQKVVEGIVPEKVLQGYIGNYQMNCVGTKLEPMIEQLYGKEFIKMNVEVTHQGNLLFMQMPCTPKMEVQWKSKDHFSASEFFQMKLVFLRGDNEEVDRLTLSGFEGISVTAKRI